jgi:hypothetical protein
MAFIGSTPSTQNLVAATDYFNGDGTTVAFTLSRPVYATYQVAVVVNNVPQNPSSAYTVVGTTITFTSAPPAGSSNIYVSYPTQVINLTAGGEAGATGGGSDQVFYLNGQTVNTSYTIPAGTNAMSAGPITIADGATVTVPDGTSWTIV